MHFHSNTMLYDGSRATRACDHGPAVSSQGLALKFFWLPTLRVGYDVPIMTTRGRVWAGDVQEGDWLVFPKYQMPDFEIPDIKHLYIKGDTHQAYCCLKKLSEDQACSLIDMMDCGDHVRDWRTDTWLFQQRCWQQWFLTYQTPFSTCSHVKVLSVGEDFCDMVNVTTPIVEAYGLQL